MKNSKFYAVVLMANFLIIASCEKVIKVNLPSLKNELVINSNSEVNQSLSVNISRSNSLANHKYNPDLAVYNATVKLFVDGVFTETLTYDSAVGYYSASSTLPGKQYTLRVSAPTYTDADATITAPSAVHISNITRIPFARKDQDGNEQDELIVTFSDPPAMGDYYIIKLHSRDDSIGFNISNFCVNSPDAGIESVANEPITGTSCLENTGIFFRDALFNGQQKNLVLYAQSYNIAPQFNGADSLFATIELIHVPEAYFRYAKSSILANNTNGDPFSEPVNVYTNVNNGLGIFSLISRDSVVIH